MFSKFSVTLLLAVVFCLNSSISEDFTGLHPTHFFVSVFRYPDLSFPNMNKIVIKIISVEGAEFKITTSAQQCLS